MTRWSEGGWQGGVLRACEHAPEQRYTREPCSCGRELWPPRGRGRGESLLSPRRVAAKLRAIEAMRLRRERFTWTTIARRLDYGSGAAACNAVERLLGLGNTRGRKRTR